MKKLIVIILALCSSISYAQIEVVQLQELQKAILAHGLQPSWYSGYSANQAIDRIAQDMYLGRVRPESLNPDVRISSKRFPYKSAVAAYTQGQMTAQQFIETIRVKNLVYTDAVNLFNELLSKKASGAFFDKPAGLVLKKLAINSKDAASVQFLRSRLNDFGYSNQVDVPFFDEQLKQQVMLFQKDHNLTADGVVGPMSWALIDRSMDQLLTQAVINIDRARWLPDNLGSNHVIVNLAAQHLKLYQNYNLIMEFETINGRLTRETPLLIDQIENVVLNPTWTVPFSIFAKDKLPILRNDPGFIARNHMKIVNDLTGWEVDPYSVNWNQEPEQLGNYTIIQSPGPWNALGFIKFTLTNPYAIYLHDTNERYLFDKDLRLLSSGCVRLQRPFDFGERILDDSRWSVDAIKSATESAFFTADKSTWLKPKNKTAVYLFYQTVFVKEGRLISLNDHYSLDGKAYSLFF